MDTAPARLPQRVTMEGRYIFLAPLDPAAHGDDLWEGTRGPENESLWQWLFDGPFEERAAFDANLRQKAVSEDPMFYAIIGRRSQRALGYASYMRIKPMHRTIEVGSILFTRKMQQTAGATEAMFLMARYAFEDLGNRRYEWKCNALNEPSRRAALRLGFSFEGIFRQHMIVKGRNRDTAWYSMLDTEWLSRKAAFERWLHPWNFDEAGTQKLPLAALR